jgi:hypothetical protein
MSGLVLVLSNLNPRKLAGFNSNGMVKIIFNLYLLKLFVFDIL